MSGEVDYVRAVIKNWIVVVVVIAAALMTTAIINVSRERVYEGSAQLIVAPAPGLMDTSDVIRSVETLDRRTVVATFARIPSAAPIQNSVAVALHLPAERAAAFQTRGSVVPNTNIIRIEVQGPDAALVASMANEAAMATAREAQSLYPIYALRMLSRAAVAESPSYPDIQRNYLIGAALGIFLGLAFALAVERVRP